MAILGAWIVANFVSLRLLPNPNSTNTIGRKKENMWNWLKGAEPPKKKTKFDKHEYMKAYEDGRIRTFNEKWRVGKDGKTRNWLFYNEESKQMHCSTCKSFAALIDLILTLLASTCECERGFSAMKAVKIDWGNRLKADTLMIGALILI